MDEQSSHFSCRVKCASCYEWSGTASLLQSAWPHADNFPLFKNVFSWQRSHFDFRSRLRAGPLLKICSHDCQRQGRQIFQGQCSHLPGETSFQAPFAELLSADCACRCSFERSLFEAEHVAVFTEVALWMSSPLTLAAERSVPAVTNGAE